LQKKGGDYKWNLITMPGNPLPKLLNDTLWLARNYSKILNLKKLLLSPYQPYDKLYNNTPHCNAD
jgi:hypothetical protein